MKHRPFFYVRRACIVACHLAIIATSLSSAFLLRFDFSVARADVPLLYRGLQIALGCKILVFTLAKLHRGWWRFVSIADLTRVFFANVVASMAFAALATALIGPEFPRSVYFIDFGICFLLTAGARFVVRVYSELVLGELPSKGRKRLLIYGAGLAGMTLVRELRNNARLGEVIGFLDDDPAKKRQNLMGIAILGAGRDAAPIVDRQKRRGRAVDEIIIAMPSANGRQMRDALANCKATGVACKTIPGIGELLTGKVLSAQIRDVSVEDLLGREAIQLEEERIRFHIAGRTVLITGAAGSIGSELCRQAARFNPAKLIAFDQAESELFKIDLELRHKFPSLVVVPEIGDIRDPVRIGEVIRRHSVESIYHAAAYKHVPLMEAHALEAARNNILGTWNLVHAAYQNDVADFLMISSDKAVNPVSIMGATKRVAELIVNATPVSGEKTKFVSVRFGNVLGSNGSVVPIFKEQIAHGGPVTVTHPDMRRYFMTIREAVQLVLQASTMSNGSEIFVLDMGEPIKVVDLARNMIRLSGLVPDEDVEIRFTGLRPGEKLFEEIMTQGENILPTYHEKIKIFQGQRLKRAAIADWIAELERLLERREVQPVIDHLAALAPEYVPRKAAAVADGKERFQTAAQ